MVKDMVYFIIIGIHIGALNFCLFFKTNELPEFRKSILLFARS